MYFFILVIFFVRKSSYIVCSISQLYWVSWFKIIEIVWYIERATNNENTHQHHKTFSTANKSKDLEEFVSI